MKTNLLVTVQVRPHSERVEINGQSFTDPASLWDWLHVKASHKLEKPPSLRRSVFVTGETLEAMQRALEGATVTKVRAKTRGTRPAKANITLEEMGL